MNTENWYRQTVGDDSDRAVAIRAGIPTATLNRQAPARVAPENIVKIARAYEVPVVQSLIETGLIEPADVAEIAGRGALEDATDAQLADEVLRRMKLGGESAQVYDLPISRVSGMDEDERRAASHDQGGLEESDLD